jgi:uncharacterized protein (TIGR03905 family)
LTDGVVRDVKYTGGCDGNLKAIAKLIDGRPASEIVALFKGHQCKKRGTSCADQLSRALEEAMSSPRFA